MIFPLEQLVKFTGNVYEITVASSRRAYQMAKINDSEIEEKLSIARRIIEEFEYVRRNSMQLLKTSHVIKNIPRGIVVSSMKENKYLKN